MEEFGQTAPQPAIPYCQQAPGRGSYAYFLFHPACPKEAKGVSALKGSSKKTLKKSRQPPARLVL